jgi:hypothetical protein
MNDQTFLMILFCGVGAIATLWIYALISALLTELREKDRAAAERHEDGLDPE